MVIDTTTYDKTKRGIGTGWDYRQNASPKSILVHTTNGNLWTQFDSEVRYLYYSNVVGSHYIIGKQGQVVQLLHPRYRAWHAGAVYDSRYNNNNSIGIEVHYTPGEGSWTSLMYQRLTELVRQLKMEYKIFSTELVERHRRVAIPAGRKIDPSGMTDVRFQVWRNGLFSYDMHTLIQYRVIKPEVNVRQSPCIRPDNIAGSLLAGDTFYSAAIKQDECGGNVNGITTYAHVTHGYSRDKPVDGLGFVHTSVLTIIG